MREWMTRQPTVQHGADYDTEIVVLMDNTAMGNIIDRYHQRLAFIEDALRQYDHNLTNDHERKWQEIAVELRNWIEKALAIEPVFRQAQVDWQNTYEPF